MKKLFKCLIVAVIATVSLFLIACNGASGNTNNDGGKPSETNVYYSVTFRQDGTEDIVKTVKAGATLTDIPSVKEKTGYELVWNRADFSNIQEDILVTVKETPKKYTITFDANGGTIGKTTETVIYDGFYQFVSPEKTGGAFVGWKTQANESFPSQGIWKVDGDLSLKAEWDIATYTVVFNKTDGTTATVTKNVGEFLTESDVPTFSTEKGYDFAWDTENILDLQETKTITEIKTAKAFKIIFDVEEENVPSGVEILFDETANIYYLNVFYGQKISLFEPKPSLKQTFVKWTISGGTDEYATLNGKEFLFETYEILQNITLKPVWQDAKVDDEGWSDIA